jgi:hypothetical protein
VNPTAIDPPMPRAGAAGVVQTRFPDETQTAAGLARSDAVGFALTQRTTMARPTHAHSLLFAAAGCIVSLPAQGLLWSQRQPAASPGGRAWHAMAYDGARQHVVMFGGYNGGEPTDTWTWDGLSWTNHPQATLPGRRWHAMAYDAARQQVVMYGGQSAGTYPTQTFLWNGTNWTAVTTATNPGATAKHGMAYDSARQRIVLFGGNVFANPVWEWDGAGWVSFQPAIAPAPRNENALAYDPVRQRTVLYGGQLGPGSNFAYANDTWLWDGSAWTQVATANAPAGNRYPWGQMAFDASRGTVVLHSGSASFAANDTWEFDGIDWQVAASGGALLNRVSGAMVYDDARQSLLFFGGMTSTAPGAYLNSTYTSYLLATAAVYGNGCGSPAMTLVPDPSQRPILGQSAQVMIGNVPGFNVALAAGWSRTSWGGVPLPFSLAQFGMPGCDLLQSVDLLGIAATPTGPGTFSAVFGLPWIPSLLGQRLHLQAYAFAPGQNQAGIVVSNGVEWRFGSQ